MFAAYIQNLINNVFFPLAYLLEDILFSLTCVWGIWWALKAIKNN